MIVVDASVAAKWLFPEEAFSDRALALLEAHLTDDEAILAPPLLPSEVTNTLRQRMRRENVTRERALALLEQFLALPLVLTVPDGLYRRALILADEHALPATYDAQYVALAERLNCDLWTDDQRLLRGVGTALPFVRWVGGYPSASDASRVDAPV